VEELTSGLHAGMGRAADNRALRDSPPGQDSWSRVSVSTNHV